jgi:hypothetical protein
MRRASIRSAVFIKDNLAKLSDGEERAGGGNRTRV